MLALLRDLANGGYVEERDDRGFKSQPFGLEWLSFKVTGKGSRLLSGGDPPNPLIADPRK